MPSPLTRYAERSFILPGPDAVAGDYRPEATPSPPSEGYATRHRLQAKGDLRRIADPQARQFRRENPAADIYDWERFKDVMESRGEEEKP